VVVVRLFVERNIGAWNRAVEASPYAVLHHKYEVLAFGGKNVLPLVFEEGENRLLFPLTLEDLFGFKLATVPVYDYASVLPNCSEAIALIPEALDLALELLKKLDVDFLTMSVPFFLPGRYVRLLNKMFKEKNASIQQIFVHGLSTREKSFEEIWMNNFSKHARNRARKAEKEGVAVREIKTFGDRISDMHLCNMSSFYRQKRYPRYPHSERDAFLVYLNRHKAVLGENYRVYGAFFGKRLIAYTATVQFNKSIIISLMMSLSNFLSKCPNDALLRYIVHHACEDKLAWIFYSFDRVSQSSQRSSLLSPLVKFKFDHGFREYHMDIFSLGFTRAGRVLQQLMAFYNLMFVSSAGFPSFLTAVLQKLYERQRYRKSRYEYVRAELQRGVASG